MISPQICGLDERTQEALISVFKKNAKIASVTLFGSRAKGNHKNGSDIDLAAHGANITFQEFLSLQGAIDDLMLPYKVDLVLFQDIESKDLLDHIARVGKKFYDALGGLK